MSGKKRLPESMKKRTYATKLAPDVIAFFRHRLNAATTIEGLVRKSKEFREWVRDGRPA